MNSPTLRAERLSKSFGSRPVLQNVGLELLPGEIHGLLGQNGSGKSTLIKILAGYHPPDPGGLLEIGGRRVPLPLRPGASRRLGLAFVHQDLALAQSLSVLDNIRIGKYRVGPGWWISWKHETRVVREMLNSFGVHIDPQALIESLRDVERAMVSIVRAIGQLDDGARVVLVLDEPTAYLPRDGVNRLFKSLREIAATGVAVLFVSHRLDEVRAITDRVTILRDGKVVENAPTRQLTERDLIQRILGRSLEQFYLQPHHSRADVILEVQGLAGGTIRDFALSLHQGEILGLTGLLGMGYERIPYLLFGAERAASGSLWIGGTKLDVRSLSPSHAMRAGLALLPGNRHQLGAVAAASVAENVMLSSVGQYFRRMLLDHRREKIQVGRLLSKFQVTPPEPDRMFGTLSGGNQQKALVGKWFEGKPRVLLLHEPSQGVDVGARQQIFAQIREAALSGQSVIISSSEYEDLAHLCDRVLVFRDGRVVSALQGESLTYDRIIERCFATVNLTQEATSDGEPEGG